MFRLRRRLPPTRAARPVALAALLLSSTTAFAQVGNVPTARHTAPGVAVAGQHTPVTADFTLPSGYSLVGFPKMRVVDLKGRLIELLPIYLSQRPPSGRGQRALHTKNYKPGVYMVRLEVSYRDPAGRPGTVPSALSTLTVPAR